MLGNSQDEEAALPYPLRHDYGTYFSPENVILMLVLLFFLIVTLTELLGFFGFFFFFIVTELIKMFLLQLQQNVILLRLKTVYLGGTKSVLYRARETYF